MVTIYTERGPASELLEERRSFSFGRMAAVSLGAALLFSLAAAYNLSADVKDLDKNKIPVLQQQIAESPLAQRLTF